MNKENASKLCKKILGILLVFLLWSNSGFSEITEKLLKLDKLYKDGSITKEEFIKAKSIILEIDSNTKNYNINRNKNLIKVNKFKDSKMSFEKMEMLFDDYRIYTHRSGGIKIRRISDNKQLVVFSDKFKIKFYNDGEELFDFILDEGKKKISVQFKGLELFNWQGTYISKHQAYFFQILTSDNKPFHYYIKFLGGKPSIALNMKKFDKKIENAIAKVKVRLAAKYNITLEQIELILKRKKIAKENQLEKIIGEEKEKAIKGASEEVLQASLNDVLAKELEETIGDAMAKEFADAIIDGMEDELINAVNEAVSNAVASGISEAAAAAGIRVALEVLAAGGTEQEAWDAGCAAAGQDPGC